MRSPRHMKGQTAVLEARFLSRSKAYSSIAVPLTSFAPPGPVARQRFWYPISASSHDVETVRCPLASGYGPAPTNAHGSLAGTRGHAGFRGSSLHSFPRARRFCAVRIILQQVSSRGIARWTVNAWTEAYAMPLKQAPGQCLGGCDKRCLWLQRPQKLNSGLERGVTKLELAANCAFLA